MPDEPQTPVADPAPEAQPEAPVGPTAEELMAALQQERQRAEQIARERDMATHQAQMAWTQRPQPQQPAEDPARSIFNDAISNPDAAADKFRSFVSSAMDQAAARERQISEQRTAQMLDQTRLQMTLQNALDRHPDLTSPERMPDFVGEVARVKAIYEANGAPQSPSVYIEKAAQALRQRGQPQRTPVAPAYVEGGGTGSLGANPAAPPQAVPQQNPLEKIYKMPAGMIIDPPSGDEALDEVKKFVLAENAEREKHQVMPAYSDVMVRD